MKTTFYLLLTLFSIKAFGQEKLKIEIDNPEPRIGQSVIISINDNFLTDYLRTQIGTDIDINSSTSFFGIETNKLERTIIFNQAKKYTIGPINFKFNDINYTSNSIQVNVLPELPLKSGLWIRLVESEDQKYLILEQLIKNVSNSIKEENGTLSQNIGGIKPKEVEYAKLKKKITDGIDLSTYTSSTNILREKDSEIFDLGYTYSIIKYKIKFKDNFNGIYIISSNDIENLPEIYDIGHIEIKM